MRKTLFVLCAAVLLCAVPAFAQTANVQNPSQVTFTPSPDHALIDSYEMDILKPDGTVLQTLNLGKPVSITNAYGTFTCTATDPLSRCYAAVSVQPVAFGVGYSAQMRAKVGSVVGPSNVSDNKFDRVPGGPTKIVIK